MKTRKLTAILAAALLVCSMATSAFAAKNFVGSVENNEAPEVSDETTNSNPNWDGDLVVTPMSDLSSLPAEKRAEIQEAYETITSAKDLGELNDGLAALADKKGVEIADLLISDLFDISYTESSNGEEPGTFSIKLNLQTLENFVALLHYNGTEWEIVPNVKVTGNSLSFKADDLSPFAIVVADENALPDSPQTGDSMIPTLCMGLAVVFAAAGMTCFMVGKKKAVH